MRRELCSCMGVAMAHGVAKVIILIENETKF